MDSELLAKELKVKWYVGEAIPDDLRPERSKVRELVRIKRDRYAMTYRDKEGQEYAIVGKIKDLDDLEEVMADIALACVVGSLIGAGLLAYWLSRRLVSPLVELTGKVNRGEALDDTLLCSRDDEVGDLARAFAGREQALREFLNREQLFTGDVSHELRTPLTVLQGGVEILESRLSGDDKLLPIVGRMQRTVASMTAMVGTMLLLARKPEQLEFRPFDLCVLARRGGGGDPGALARRPVTFSSLLPDRLTVLGSPELAAMVLHNLLDNACRYTEQGRILLEFRADEMLLTDTAPVIDPDVRTRMFERGVRGTSKSPGSGLGLSLVLRGCEHLGWKVAHEHWEGGNRFRVCFSQG
ncbi:MAG: histidine kinase dimerization/phospho-acceptor domain-containing protein [Bilophila wadsworthia]